MRQPFLCTMLLTLLGAAPLAAQCPCVPLTHLWIVKTCSDWNCASTDLLLAGGDPQVIAVPVAMDDTRWLIMRRLVAGSAVNVSDDPFQLRQFDGMEGAIAHYAALTYDRHPMLFTAPDGQVLVISLKQPEPRRRAASH
jgi:hypothetical protein